MRPTALQPHCVAITTTHKCTGVCPPRAFKYYSRILYACRILDAYFLQCDATEILTRSLPAHSFTRLLAARRVFCTARLSSSRSGDSILLYREAHIAFLRAGLHGLGQGYQVLPPPQTYTHTCFRLVLLAPVLASAHVAQPHSAPLSSTQPILSHLVPLSVI